jgi:single-stranded DNA-binding protein
MIAAMIQGELSSEPVARTTSKGAKYATATARVAAGADALFVGIAAFDAAACARLLTLHKGAAIAAAGVLEQTEWRKDEETRRGWRMVAQEVLTVHAARKRREVEATE